MNTSLPNPTCPCFTPTPGLLLMLTAHLHFVFFYDSSVTITEAITLMLLA